MFIVESSGTNQSLLYVLLSGGLGAIIATVFATVFNVLWSKHLDAANKSWTLKAELRRFHVNRITDASNGLRQCFYKAKTQLEFNLSVVVGIESEWSALRSEGRTVVTTSGGITQENFDKRCAAVELRLHDSIARSNDRIVLVQAEAKSHVSLLLSEPLLENFHGQMQSLMRELAKEHQATPKGVRERIEVFKDREPVFLQLLRECDKVIDAEIAKALI